MLSSEGLIDPLLLNEFKPLKVVIDYQPNSDTSVYWHRYLLSFSEAELKTALAKISTSMKAGWYSIFWNEKKVYVVFNNKVFTLDRETNWNSSEYQKVKKYGIDHGVQEEYLDFNERFRYYKSLLENV